MGEQTTTTTAPTDYGQTSQKRYQNNGYKSNYNSSNYNNSNYQNNNNNHNNNYNNGDMGQPEHFRARYGDRMQAQESSFNERFDILDAMKLKDNLEKGIYEEALAYLTGSGEDQRGLSLKTLSKYNVGLGTEKFTNEDGMYQGYDSIHFPLYMPRKDGGK